MAKQKQLPEKCGPEVLAVAKQVRTAHHKNRLQGAVIAYVFDPACKLRGGRVTLGKAGKQGPVARLLTGADFVICLNRLEWEQADTDARKATLDHELCHCDVNDAGGWAIRPHDIEAFADELNRHGLWRAGLKRFAEATSRQLGLFDGTDRDGDNGCIECGKSSNELLDDRCPACVAKNALDSGPVRETVQDLQEQLVQEGASLTLTTGGRSSTLGAK